MNKLIALTLLALAVSSSALARPKYAPTTVRLIDSNEYVRKNAAPDFWALIPHYVQQGENMCQTASMVAILNALRNGDAPDSETKNITQKDLVAKVNDPAWNKAMKTGKCYSLDEFAEIVRKAIPLYFKDRQYDVRVEHVQSAEPAQVEKYLADFRRNEESAKDFIIANFDQAVFTGEAEPAGHVSPVAAYDAAGKRFLVLDVDREWYTPYWVPEAEFFKAMATADARKKELKRGYLVISPRARQ